VRQQNLEVLGETADLNEFLFGSERAALAVVRPVLLDIQRGRCFYCQAPLTPAATHVDHFIAWARYPVDLGHNFVLADSKCNSQKRDRLPACDHLRPLSLCQDSREHLKLAGKPLTIGVTFLACG
jgi:5-methylcytosine-specific restriction endonuclease McrA